MNKARVIVLYDNRSDRHDLQPGWGFSALIEFGGNRVLFDTGADKLVLEHNAAALGVELKATDYLFFSHEHCDHIGAVSSALHPGITVVYPASFSRGFKKRIEKAKLTAVPVTGPVEFAPAFRSTGELGEAIKEQSLIIEGKDGPILITGCAHPGIIEIARVATDLAGGPLHLVLGGFHLYKKNEAAVEEIAVALKRLGVKGIAPCHCTGMAAMKTLQNAFANASVDVKVGTEIVL